MKETKSNDQLLLELIEAIKEKSDYKETYVLNMHQSAINEDLMGALLSSDEISETFIYGLNVIFYKGKNEDGKMALKIIDQEVASIGKNPFKIIKDLGATDEQAKSLERVILEMLGEDRAAKLRTQTQEMFGEDEVECDCDKCREESGDIFRTAPDSEEVH